MDEYVIQIKRNKGKNRILKTDINAFLSSFTKFLIFAKFSGSSLLFIATFINL